MTFWFPPYESLNSRGIQDSSLLWASSERDKGLHNTIIFLLFLQDDGWKLSRTNYYQEGWLATANVRGVVGVTYTTSFCAGTAQGLEIPARTNYNLRGHRSEVGGIEFQLREITRNAGEMNMSGHQSVDIIDPRYWLFTKTTTQSQQGPVLSNYINLSAKAFLLNTKLFFFSVFSFVFW